MKKGFTVALFLSVGIFLWPDGAETYQSASKMLGEDPNAGRNAFPILSIPGGGKYEGMATAHTAMALDGGYLESNPAGGSFLPHSILSFSHIDWIADSAVENLTYAFRPQKAENLGIGFSGKFFHIPFTGYNDTGSLYENTSSSVAGLYTEFIATAALSYNFFRSFYFGGVSFGAGVKIGYRSVSNNLASEQNALSVMGDFGILSRFNFLKYYASRDMNFAVGLTVKNIGAEFIADSDPLPTYASIGISYKFIRPITLALDLNIPFNINGEDSNALSFAAGLNADVAEFLSLHTGFLIKKGKPRFAIGTDVQLKNFTLAANYTLDLTTRLELFDRMSVTIKIDMDTVRQLIIIDDVQSLYLQGLDAYSAGKTQKAITILKQCLALDVSFLPAKEMLETAYKMLEEEKKIKAAVSN